MGDPTALVKADDLHLEHRYPGHLSKIRLSIEEEACPT
jgi:hypothetical protein